MPTTVLITGANRGIGRGLVAAYLARPDHVVVAAVRDPSNSTSKTLPALPAGDGSSLIIVPLDGSSDTSALDAVELLKTKHGIKSIDLVIANAGIANFYGTALQTPLAGTREHLNINVVAPLALFQAVHPLLSAASTPKFITVTSTVGSIGEMDRIPMISTAYGASKAALNYITRKIHFEYPDIITFPINPGWLKTEMGNAGAEAHGMTEAPVEVEDGVKGIVSQIDKATRENSSGKFITFDGAEPSW